VQTRRRQWLCLVCAGLGRFEEEIQRRLGVYRQVPAYVMQPQMMNNYGQLVFDMLNNCQWRLFREAFPYLVELHTTMAVRLGRSPIGPRHALCYVGMGLMEVETAKAVATMEAEECRHRALSSKPSGLQHERNYNYQTAFC
jgi:hypothetical protein